MTLRSASVAVSYTHLTLPTITDQVTIDGSTAPGYDGSAPLITLNGSAAGSSNGLHFDTGSDGSELRGLAIVNFNKVGVLLTNAGGHTVAGNYIGTDGATNQGNGWWGLEMTNSANNTIGGTTDADRNVISGSGYGGVTFWGAGASNNTVIGNYIGTNCLLYTSPSPRDGLLSRMPSSA